MHCPIEFGMHDTGIGMGPDSLPRLFTPFSRLRMAGPHRGGGTGLGLVISQKLVRLMGGEITVISEPGKGSTFRFALELPVTEGYSSVNVATQAIRTEALSFLVAEDNAVNQMIIVAMLRQLGHTVTVAANGREALKRWHANTSTWCSWIATCPNSTVSRPRASYAPASPKSVTPK